MATPFITPVKAGCFPAAPGLCGCGFTVQALDEGRVEYELDVHLVGVERAGRIQMDREQLLVRMDFSVPDTSTFTERMLFGSSPKLRKLGGAA